MCDDHIRHRLFEEGHVVLVECVPLPCSAVADVCKVGEPRCLEHAELIDMGQSVAMAN